MGKKTKAAFAATYVGQERCAAFHAEQVQAWRTSHHTQAMQVASDSSVLGNFNNANFAKDEGSEFYVHTDTGLRASLHLRGITITAVSGAFSSWPAAELRRGLGLSLQTTRRPALVRPLPGSENNARRSCIGPGTAKRGITCALIADLLHQSSGQLSQGVTACNKLISDVLQTARS